MGNRIDFASELGVVRSRKRRNKLKVGERKVLREMIVIGGHFKDDIKA